MKFPGWTVVVLQSVFDMKKMDNLHNSLRQLPEGSTGKVVADLLDERNFRLIPKFPNHDLKHAVLDYQMKMEDEIKMQAYLVGNGNYTWPCLLFLSLGIFRPKIWKELIVHYNQGKHSPNIFNLNLMDVIHTPIKDLQIEFGRKKLMPTKPKKTWEETY